MNVNRTLAVGVASVVLLATVGAAPAAAAPWDSPDTTQVTFGADSTPSWHVHVTDGDLSTLESWANGSESRDVITTHNASNYALVTAPESAAGVATIADLLGSGLKGQSYVTDVRPNYEHSFAEPVTLKNSSDVDAPSRTIQTLTSARSLGGAEWSQSGVAYQPNANKSTLRDVRNVTGVANVSATGQGATIAVIDTGVNTANGRVFGNSSTNSDPRVLPASKDFLTNETVAADGLDAVSDPNGHGSWVAAAAAANASGTKHDGMAPNADILALRALDADGSGSTADIAQAVRYAADQGADVIVMSLGSPVYDAELAAALEYAQAENVSAITIAAGNSRQTTRYLASPADAPVPGVTAVSATNTTSNGSAGTAYFANVGNDPGATDLSNGVTAGQNVDVSAPGMAVTAKVATESGGTTLDTKSGTSMSAPVAIGIAALGVETNEAWVGDAAAFRNQSRATARPMPNAAAVEVGQGMIAGDRLLANETGGNQEQAMDSDAQSRNEFWGAAADMTDLFSVEFSVP